MAKEIVYLSTITVNFDNVTADHPFPELIGVEGGMVDVSELKRARTKAEQLEAVGVVNAINTVLEIVKEATKKSS